MAVEMAVVHPRLQLAMALPLAGSSKVGPASAPNGMAVARCCSFVVKWVIKCCSVVSLEWWLARPSPREGRTSARQPEERRRRQGSFGVTR